MNEKRKPQDGEIDLLYLAKALIGKFYWLLLAGVVLAVGVYLVVTFLVAPTYKSRVSFYVYNSSNGASQSGTINNSDLMAAESLATTYSKILTSNSVLDAVLTDMDDNNGLSRKELGQMVNVSVISSTQLLEVVVTSTDPQLACRIANAFIDVAPGEIVRITKAGGVEVMDWPEVATEKSSPSTGKDCVLGFMLGVVLAAAVIIIRALSDTTIYLPEDIEKLTGATVLGQIPNIEVTNGEYAYWTLSEGGTVSNGAREKQS